MWYQIFRFPGTVEVAVFFTAALRHHSLDYEVMAAGQFSAKKGKAKKKEKGADDGSSVFLVFLELFFLCFLWCDVFPSSQTAVFSPPTSE